MEKQIIEWLKDKVEKAGMKGLVLGMSGGLDSSVVAVLCKRAFPDNCLGVIMPCGNSIKDEKDATKVAVKFKIPTKQVQLLGVFTRLHDEMEGNNVDDTTLVALGNIKARLRMTTLYYFANSLNYLVVGTGNRSELSIGYFTKYGDGGVDLLPIGNITKTGVREMAKRLEIPDDIIAKWPSAGLWPGQTDEEDIGVTYEDLDKLIENPDRVDCLDMKTVENLLVRMKTTEHKRELPKVC